MKVKSKKPKKQRLALHTIKQHQTSKLFMVRLDEPLQEEWGIKRMPLRKDDEVRVIKNEMVDVEGKVLSLNRRTRTIQIEECTLEKKSGATYYIPISPSNVILTKFGGKKMDSWRQKIIDRKQKLEIEVDAKKKISEKKGGK
ncbi:MAG: 50S ribosomal protein L24 [Candidatus Lokiarchaeota archaeon]|nr:50S ribosomal protein L24 [Candidatus Lokiarchaeota archaeon]